VCVCVCVCCGGGVGGVVIDFFSLTLGIIESFYYNVMRGVHIFLIKKILSMILNGYRSSNPPLVPIRTPRIVIFL